MDNFPNLFTTEVQIDSSSETSDEWDSEILKPQSDYLVAPTDELKNFGKFHLSRLTKEGRERVKSLCTNPRREGLLGKIPTHQSLAQHRHRHDLIHPYNHSQTTQNQKEHCQNCCQRYQYQKTNINLKHHKIIPENLLNKSKLIFQYLHKIHDTKILPFQSLFMTSHLRKTLKINIE